MADYYMEQEYDKFEEQEYLEMEIEQNWNKGVHEMKNGKTIKIKDMTLSHLLNTIKYFKERSFDVSKLEKELKNRGILPSKAI